MVVKFLGEPRRVGGGLEADAEVDGAALAVVVTDEALQALGVDPAGPGGAGRLLADREELIRRVVLDKLGSAGRQRPDRLLVLAADVADRRD